MGLPMFREPDEVDSDDAANKIDQTAASRRSPIRRESPPTQRRRHANFRYPANPPTRRREREEALLNEQFDEADRDIAQLEAELERLRRHRVRARARVAHDSAVIARSTSQIAGVSLSDITQRAAPSPPRIPRRSLESVLRLSADPALRETDIAAAVRRHNAINLNLQLEHQRGSEGARGRATPVRSPNDGVSRRVPDGPVDLTPTLTPGFAPARSVHVNVNMPQMAETENIDNESRPGSARHLSTMYAFSQAERDEDDVLPADQADHRPSRARDFYLSFDGPSDHPSPASDDSVNEDHWTSLYPITTETAPRASAHSSFSSSTTTTTSSTTSASISRSQTTAATSFGEISQTDDSCDLDQLAPGITEEDVRIIRERHRGTTGRRVQNELRRESEMELPPEIESNHLRLSVFQGLLERLARREDIPEEWWAAAGLARTV